MEEGTCPDKPQFMNRKTNKDVRFAIQDGISPVIPAPDTSKKLKDVSSPIEEGSSCEESTAAIPKLSKNLRLRMELGIGPEKLVLLTSKSFRVFCDEKLGNEPDIPKLYLISTTVKFLFWKILIGNHPSSSFLASLRTLREGKSAKDCGNWPYNWLYCKLTSLSEWMLDNDSQIGA